MTARAALEQEVASQVQRALEQLSAHPFWQEQAEPIRQETNFLVSYENAKALMERHEWKNAIAEASKLPSTGLWEERKSNLISQARTALQQQEFCETFSFGFFQCQR